MGRSQVRIVSSPTPWILVCEWGLFTSITLAKHEVCPVKHNSSQISRIWEPSSLNRVCRSTHKGGTLAPNGVKLDSGGCWGKGAIARGWVVWTDGGGALCQSVGLGVQFLLWCRKSWVQIQNKPMLWTHAVSQCLPGAHVLNTHYLTLVVKSNLLLGNRYLCSSENLFPIDFRSHWTQPSPLPLIFCCITCIFLPH